MNRPNFIAPNGGAIPQELKDIKRWVLWKAEPRDGKWTKPPYQANGSPAKVNDPTTWTGYSEAWKAYYDGEGRYDGIGIVLNGDGLVGIDIDKAVDGKNATDAAKKIMATVGSYSEYSPSGGGLRIFCRGKLPAGGRRKGNFEFYETARFLTITGKSFEKPVPIADRTKELAKAHAMIFGNGNGDKKENVKSSRHFQDWRVILDKAFNSKNGNELQSLWNGIYGDDHSAADQALCNRLAFWFGADAQIMDMVFRESGLFRPKWDEKHFSDGRTYGQGTIEKAIAGCHACYWEGIQQQHPTPDKKVEPGATSRAETADGENMTDLGNAKRLVRLHGADIKYVVQWDSWYIWDGIRWKKDEELLIDKLAESVVKDIDLESSQTDDKEKRIVLRKGAVAAEANQKRRAMLEMARSRVATTVKKLDSEKWLLTLRNATVELKDCKVRETRREDNITKRADVVYDQSAQCPNWLEFLRMVTADNAETMAFMQRAAGYSLTGVCDERCIFILYGTGKNGKSTFVETIANILDEYAVRTPTETLLAKQHDGIPNDVAALKSARFVHAAEAKEGRHLSEALVKDLTGNDTISARFMRQEWFQFRPEFKIWLSTNHRPQISGTDDAIWDRIKLIPFNVRIPVEKLKPMSEVDAMFREERSGIFNWMLQGLIYWRANGLGDCEEVKRATNDYRSDMDILREFFDEKCTIDRTKRVPVAAFYGAYLAWCETVKERAIGKRSFGNRMIERGYIQTKATGGERVWLGIGLNE